VAGEFWEDISDYRQRLGQLGITNQVIFVNHYIRSEEVGLYFSAADIFAAPYIGGTQSGAVKTAMAFGLPLVLTDSLIDPLVNRYSNQIQVVPPANAEAIANAIQILVEIWLCRPTSQSNHHFQPWLEGTRPGGRIHCFRLTYQELIGDLMKIPTGLGKKRANSYLHRKTC